MKSSPMQWIHSAAAAALILVLPLTLSCGQRSSLVREILPTENIAVDILQARAARVRSIYCEITVEPVDEARWKDLMKAAAYRKPGPQMALQRTPTLSAFLVLLKNTLNAPLRIEKAQIVAGDAVMEALRADGLGARFRSPAYGWCDFDRLLSIRRMTGEQEALYKIDIDRDTIETRLDFIPPRDTVLAVMAFEKIPPGIRRFKLRFSIAALGGTREVLIDFTRREYRAADTGKNERVPDDDE
ncbi:MAG: hypothetical protein KA369_23970 [Spirochaetes bacterium]|nr:hypothetical protein [Spirochaetota bacterium]